MLRSFSVSNCCGGQRPLSLTCWSKRPKKKRKDKKDCMKKRCSPFLALSFWLTRLLFSFAITEGRCLLSTGSLAVIRWTALYAASEHLPFSSLFFLFLVWFWFTTGSPPPCPSAYLSLFAQPKHLTHLHGQPISRFVSSHQHSVRY